VIRFLSQQLSDLVPNKFFEIRNFGIWNRQIFVFWVSKCLITPLPPYHWFLVAPAIIIVIVIILVKWLNGGKSTRFTAIVNETRLEQYKIVYTYSRKNRIQPNNFTKIKMVYTAVVVEYLWYPYLPSEVWF